MLSMGTDVKYSHMCKKSYEISDNNTESLSVFLLPGIYCIKKHPLKYRVCVLGKLAGI